MALVQFSHPFDRRDKFGVVFKLQPALINRGDRRLYHNRALRRVHSIPCLSAWQLFVSPGTAYSYFENVRRHPSVKLKIDMVRTSRGSCLRTCRRKILRSVRAELSSCCSVFMEISLITTLGTGLGTTTQRSWDFVLPLSRERVEQMDGDLQVTTAPGQGTKVVVVLPVPGEKTKLALLSGSS